MSISCNVINWPAVKDHLAGIKLVSSWVDMDRVICQHRQQEIYFTSL